MIGTAVWIDGVPRQEDAAHVSVRDRGLTLADGVFETMRARRGTVFRLEQHLARLGRALEIFGIPAPPTLREWVVNATGAAQHDEASVRLTVTRGIARTGGVAPQPDSTPTSIVSVSPMPSFPSAIYERGLTARIASGRRNEHAMSAGLKTLAYTDAVLALMEAQRSGEDEALLLDTQGHCSEATSSNLFIWTGTMLRTPPTSCAALPGITRAAILEIARAQRLTVEEGAFGPGELERAAEAFLTSSLRGVAPLVRVDGRPIGLGAPGEVTRQLAAAYLDLVIAECGA